MVYKKDVVYRKATVSISEGVSDTVDRLSEEFGVPKSCVFNIAVEKPEAYKKLLAAAGVVVSEDMASKAPLELKEPVEKDILEPGVKVEASETEKSQNPKRDFFDILMGI